MGQPSMTRCSYQIRQYFIVKLLVTNTQAHFKFLKQKNISNGFLQQDSTNHHSIVDSSYYCHSHATTDQTQDTTNTLDTGDAFGNMENTMDAIRKARKVKFLQSREISYILNQQKQIHMKKM
jgi:hypothetical protein